MNRDLDSYIKVFPKAVNKKQCDEIIEELKNNPDTFSKHTFYNPNKNSSYAMSGDKELEISYLDSENQKSVMNICWQAILNYVQELDFEHFRSWQGFSLVRWNKYSQNQKMAKHCDHIHSLFTGNTKGIPILSILGLLNEDYEGGDLVFFDDKKINTSAGDIIIFPSNFLYPHQVLEVTKGERWSFVSWVW